MSTELSHCASLILPRVFWQIIMDKRLTTRTFQQKLLFLTSGQEKLVTSIAVGYGSIHLFVSVSLLLFCFLLQKGSRNFQEFFKSWEAEKWLFFFCFYNTVRNQKTTKAHLGVGNHGSVSQWEITQLPCDMKGYTKRVKGTESQKFNWCWTALHLTSPAASLSHHLSHPSSGTLPSRCLDSLNNILF